MPAIVMQYFLFSLINGNLQAKKSQPKGDDWSDCAKNGYAGMSHTMNSLSVASVLFW